MGGGGTGYGINVVGLRPDVVSSGNVVTLRISGGFLGADFKPDQFLSTNKYVSILQGTDLIAFEDNVPETLNDPNKITILRDPVSPTKFFQKLIYIEGQNATNVQAIELVVEIGRNVPAGLYHVDIECGQVKAYSDALSAAYKGSGNSHRLINGLAIGSVKYKDNDNDEAEYAMLFPLSHPGGTVGVASRENEDDVEILPVDHTVPITIPFSGSFDFAVAILPKGTIVRSKQDMQRALDNDDVQSRGGFKVVGGVLKVEDKLAKFQFTHDPKKKGIQMQEKNGEQIVTIGAKPGETFVAYVLVAATSYNQKPDRCHRRESYLCRTQNRRPSC
jgi:hypothetical protein